MEKGQHPDYRPRLSTQIRPDQQAALRRLIPSQHGRAIYEVILDDLIRILEKDPEVVVAAILTRNLKLDHILKLSVKCEDCGHVTQLKDKNMVATKVMNIQQDKEDDNG